MYKYIKFSPKITLHLLLRGEEEILSRRNFIFKGYMHTHTHTHINNLYLIYLMLKL